MPSLTKNPATAAMKTRLTSEQRRAAASTARRLIVVAGPGSGKTTIAAERFGIARFDGDRDASRGVLALSFARSATNELRARVMRSWGSAALCWPNRVMTIDTLMWEIVHYLLRSGALAWPDAITSLTVLDTWRGQRGCRYLTPEQGYRRVVAISGNLIASRGVRVTRAGYGIGTKSAFDEYLRNGVCTHDEIRDIVGQCVRIQPISDQISRYLLRTLGSLIVDEAFDANPLDLVIAALADEVGIPITLIGDPWQALYEFRGARPDLVGGLLEDDEFDRVEVLKSFRYQTESMRSLAEHLRASAPVELETWRVGSGMPDVALASQWAQLWSGPEWILPQSFGNIGNQTDAAIILLLDSQTRATMRQPAIFIDEAAYLLKVLDVSSEDRDSAFASVFALLLDGKDVEALDELRSAVKFLGGPRPRKLGQEAEARRLDRLGQLAVRVRAGASVVGLTVHQAKGREWNRVGLRLTEEQIGRLRRGLNRDVATDRLLYVAATRARLETVLIE